MESLQTIQEALKKAEKAYKAKQRELQKRIAEEGPSLFASKNEDKLFNVPAKTDAHTIHNILKPYLMEINNLRERERILLEAEASEKNHPKLF